MKWKPSESRNSRNALPWFLASDCGRYSVCQSFYVDARADAMARERGGYLWEAWLNRDDAARTESVCLQIRLATANDARKVCEAHAVKNRPPEQQALIA